MKRRTADSSTHGPSAVILAVFFAILGQSSFQASGDPEFLFTGRMAIDTGNERQAQAKGAPAGIKGVNHQTSSFRARALRVIDRRRGYDAGWIVIEDIERAVFRTGSSISGGSANKATKATADRADAWCVLNFLRSTARSPQVMAYQPSGDSIDAAASSADTRMQEVVDSLRNGKAPAWAAKAAKEHRPTDRPSEGVIVRPALPSEGMSDEEFRRLEQEVWDFAAGMELRWKRGGRTPAGRRYDVLTFSGSDEVLVTPAGIKLPSAPKPF